jgi:prepilin-type N-terminal cleavage/methylation domain-containing protein
MIKKNIKFNKGFTLVETLVAIAIFSTSLLGLLSILASSISDTTYAKQKMTADYLAQEGIETIRNMRDTFALYDTTSGQHGWDAFNAYLSTHSCTTLPNGCYFNIDNIFSIAPPQPMTKITLLACSSPACASNPILYVSTTGKYGYIGVNSGFSRQIKITQINANETRVFSTVYWKQGSGSYSITFSEDLFNWIE